MPSVVLYQDLLDLEKKLDEKLDKEVYELGVKEITTKVEDTIKKVNEILALFDEEGVKKIEALSEIDLDTLNNLQNDINELKELLSGSNDLIQEEVKKVLEDNGTIDYLIDKVSAELYRIKDDILKNIPIPVSEKDVVIEEGNKFKTKYIPYGNKLLDFIIHVYRYDENGNVIIIKSFVPGYVEENVFELDYDEDLSGNYTSFTYHYVPSQQETDEEN